MNDLLITLVLVVSIWALMAWAFGLMEEPHDRTKAEVYRAGSEFAETDPEVAAAAGVEVGAASYASPPASARVKGALAMDIEDTGLVHVRRR